MVGGDPVSVVSGGRGDGSRGGSLLDGRGLALGAARGTLLAGLAALALLGEVGGDPDGIEEVDGTSGAGQEEEVQEETKKGRVSQLRGMLRRRVLTSGGQRCWYQAQPRSQCH